MRGGCQSPSRTASSPPRTRKRPPPAAIAAGDAALYCSYCSGSVTSVSTMTYAAMAGLYARDRGAGQAPRRAKRQDGNGPADLARSEGLESALGLRRAAVPQLAASRGREFWRRHPGRTAAYSKRRQAVAFGLGRTLVNGLHASNGTHRSIDRTPGLYSIASNPVS